MPKASPIQNTFNSGELSPLMLGRQDVDKYANGLFTCFNGLSLAQGPWTRRPGTLHQKNTKFGGDRISRLLPFRFSVTQNYILEFGHLYIRFYTLGGVLVNASQAVEGVSKANPGVITITGHGYPNGQRLHLFSFNDGMEELSNQEVIVAGAGANTFQLTDIYGANIDTTNYTTWASGGATAPYTEIVTPFTEFEIDDIRITQSADVLYLFHPDHEIQKLVRETAVIWTLSDIVADDGPYMGLNNTTTTLTPSGTTGSITITASDTIGINDDLGFLATDVGRLMRIKDAALDWTWLTITARSSTTVVTATIEGPDLSDSTARLDWRLGLWSDTTGWPSTGTFFEDRLTVGGVDISPQRLDMSRSGLYESFSPTDQDGTVTDDHAIGFSLNSNDVNFIRWMVPDEKALLVGTAGGEWPVRPSSLGEATTPTNVSGKQSTSYGSAPVAPIRAGKAVLFVQLAGRKLRELAYVFEADGFKAPDMTLLAEHVSTPAMVELAYLKEPQSILFAVRSDGVLLGFTYERDQNVVAWHRHELGGTSDAQGTFAKVESVASVPTPNADRDEVFMIVERWIGGRSQRNIEVMTKVWESGDLQEDAFHLDAGFTQVDVTATNTITGLAHLEGETVDIYVDGAAHPPVVVTDAKAVLNHTGFIKTVGYSYDSDGETLPVEAGSEDGSSQGKTKRISRLGLWLMDTLGLKVGPDPSKLTEVLVRQWGDNYGQPTAIFTGVTRERFEGDYDRLGQVYWRCSGPFPATVLALMPQLVTNDDG